MKIEISTHNEILVNPIIELDRTVDNPKNQTFTPVIIIIDANDQRRRFGQFLPEQPYINGTWTDDDVENAISQHLKQISFE